MMEIINRKHKEIAALRKSYKTSYISFYNKNEVHFSSAATHRFGLRIGMFVHFMDTEDDWYFCVNKDKDGFEIKASNRRGAVAIFDSALVSVFIKRTKCSLGTKFLITETDLEMNMGKVYKININNPLEKVNKNLLK